MRANVKIKNGKELWLKALVDSRCTHTGINEQLFKDERIKTKLVDIFFKVFNVYGTKNGKVTRIAPLEVKINGHKKQINIAVMDLNETDMFLEYDQLTKHNPEVNCKEGTIQFTRYPKICRTKHQDITFKTKRIQATESQDKDQQEIGKELDQTNLENLLEYIQSYIYIYICSIRRNLRNYWENRNGITKST